MRFVIFDDATMDPVTVVNIRGLAERDIEERGCRYRLAVPHVGPSEISAGMPVLDAMRVVDLWFERLWRDHPAGRQIRWMCFTKQEELAMMLTPDWLPGQRGAVEHVQRHNERLQELLFKLMVGL